MAEPRRHDDSASVPATRDTRMESLLVEGLEHYFSGRFDDAIHIWTRVLFLDRSHARARAYIDRARSAIAERQRRAEALLHESDELLAQGRTAAARQLLSQAIATTGDDERAAAVRLKLERIERAYAAAPQAPAGGALPRVAPAWRMPRWRDVSLAGGLLSAAALIGMLSVPDVQRWFGLTSGDRVITPATQTSRLPVMSSGEVALVRARSLYGRGRLAEALRALDRVSVDSPVRAAADQLRVEIQQILLVGGPAAGRARRASEAGSR